LLPVITVESGDDAAAAIAPPVPAGKAMLNKKLSN